MVQRGVGPEPSGGAAAVADAPRPRGLERLGRFSAKRRWWVLGVWLLIAIALGAAAAPAGKPFRDVFTIPGTDSQAAIEVLDQRFPQANLPSAQVVLHDSKGAVPTATVTAASDRDREAAAGRERLAAAGLRQRRDGAAHRHLQRRPRTRSTSTRSTASTARPPRRATTGSTVAYGGQVDRLRPAADRAAEPRGRDRAARRGHHPALRVRHGGRRVPPADRRPDRRHDRDPDPHDRRDRSHRRHGRADPRLDDRARRRHRLLVAHRQPVPSGARRRARGPRRDRDARSAPPAPRRCSRACASRSRCAGSGSPASRTSRRSASRPRCSSASWCSPRSRCCPALLGHPRAAHQPAAGAAEVEEGQGRGDRLLVPLGPRGRPPRLVVRGGQPHHPAAARRAGAEHAARVHHRRGCADRHDPARGLRPRDARGSAPARTARCSSRWRCRRRPPPNEAPDIAAAEKLLAAIKATKGVASVTPPLPNSGPRRGGRAGDPDGRAERADAPQTLVRTLRDEVIPEAIEGHARSRARSTSAA